MSQPKWEPGEKPTQKILDACCWSRMFWRKRDRQDVLFMDARKEEHTLCDGRTLTINPDVVADFRSMPFPDKSFRLVVFDPPHLIRLGESSWMAKKYGRLNADTWQDDLRRGFDECLRVLDDDGVLILKWNTRDIKASELFKALGQEPLFGSTTGRSGMTIWCVYVKGME